MFSKPPPQKILTDERVSEKRKCGLPQNSWTLPTHNPTHNIRRLVRLPRILAVLGIPDDADQCSGDADHRVRDDADHDSGMMPITRSGMMPIS